MVVVIHGDAEDLADLGQRLAVQRFTNPAGAVDGAMGTGVGEHAEHRGRGRIDRGGDDQGFSHAGTDPDNR